MLARRLQPGDPHFVIRNRVEERGVLDAVGGDQPVHLFSRRDRLVNDPLETLAQTFGDDVEVPACRRGFIGDARFE